MTLELGQGTGPLKGLKVVELAGIGPGPHACMILADLGADVIRVDRPSGATIGTGSNDLLNRGRPSIALDLKNPEAIETVLKLVEQADVLIEGMRPGVTERLGLGPDVCRERNPRLVYGRMTGWGQTGPWASAAGHDMNYIAITGALFGLGQDKSRPHFPGNLVGDFGGGSTYLVIGILAAVLEAKTSGQGQVVDAAIVDGTAHLNAMGASFLASGLQGEERVSGMLDGGSPFYNTYETSDARYITLAPIEPKFYAQLLEKLGLDPAELPAQYDESRWPELTARIAEVVRTRTRDEWTQIFAGTDACVTPVLTWGEAATDDHLRARSTVITAHGVDQAAPAPRFSRTPAGGVGRPPAATTPIDEIDW